MRRRARYRCDLDDERGEHFAIVPVSAGDRGLASILLFHAAGGRTRRHGGPEANDVYHDRLARDRGRRVGSHRLVPPYQSLDSHDCCFFDRDRFRVLFARVGIDPT